MARRAKRLWTALLAVVGFALFGLVTLVLLVKHTPSFYARLERQPAHQVAASYKTFRYTRNDLADALINEPTFRLHISDDTVNAWLIREVESRGHGYRLPDAVHSIRVQFRSRTIVVAARIQRGVLTSVAQVHLRPKADGQRVRLTIRRVKAGALPMPDAAVRALVGEVAAALSDWVAYDEPTDTIELRLPQRNHRKGRPLPKPRTIDRLEVSDGELIVEGRTGH